MKNSNKLLISIFIFFNLIIFFQFSYAGFEVKKLPPLHYSYTDAYDLIDTARFKVEYDSNVIKEIDSAVKKLGDYLSKDTSFTTFATNTILASPIGPTSKYSYGNFLVKIAESSGVRVLEVRMSKVEEELLKVSPESVVTLPFRFIFLPSEQFGLKIIHICLVDPISYISQFNLLSSKNKGLLENARLVLMNAVNQAFPDALFDPVMPDSKVSFSSTHLPLVVLNEVEVGSGKKFQNIEAVANAIKKGDVIIFGGGNSQHSYSVGGSIEDYKYLYDESAIFKGILSFPRFSAIKDGWILKDGKKVVIKDWVIPNKSDSMLTLVKNSVIHAYNDPYQLSKFDTSIGSIYQMQFFESYMHPFFMNLGIWRFASIPLSLFVVPIDSNKVAVVAHNPEFFIDRYMQSISELQIANAKLLWDTNPANKTNWPNMSKSEMGKFMLEVLKQSVLNALSY